MRIGGDVWTRSHFGSAGSNQPPVGWEIEGAQFAAERAARDLERLRAAGSDTSELDRAERRYRNAVCLLQRIRTGFEDSSSDGQPAVNGS